MLDKILLSTTRIGLEVYTKKADKSRANHRLGAPSLSHACVSRQILNGQTDMSFFTEICNADFIRT